MAKGNFIEYVVSNNSNKYPNDGEQGGYYYKLVLPALISFTIAGISYQAEEGMTWAEWCESKYNTPGCYVGTYSTLDYSIIWWDSTRYIGIESHAASPVKASDVIENGVGYTTDNSPIAPA